MKTYSKKDLQLDKKYFWDVNFSDLDLVKHRRFIIARILERGAWPEFKALISYYGYNRVKKDLTQLRYMDRKSLRFCSFYFSIPQEDFRCYRNRH